MTTTKTDQWAWWRAALAGADQPIHENQPESGFYRVRSGRGGPFVRVAIWRDKTGKVLAQRDGKAVDADQIWTWACRNPVSEAEFRKVEAGGEWSDAPPPTPVAGHNLPQDDAERLALLLREEDAAIKAWLAEGPIDDEDRAAAAAELTKRAIAYAKEAEDLRKREKKPHDDAAKAVQQKWTPIVSGFEVLNSILKRSLDDYLRKKKREAEEAAREAAREAVKDDPFGLPPVTAPIKASVGNVGATVTLRTYKVARITDMAAFLTANATNATIIEAAQKVANALARAGASSPGMETVTEERAA
jgi:hypothetical protein